MDIIKYIDGNTELQDNINRILKHKEFDIAAAAIELQMQDSSISECTPKSVCNAIIKCAMLDLSLNKEIGEAYIIPYAKSYKDSDGNWQKIKVAEFQIGYKGLVNLALSSNRIQTLNAIPIHKGEIKSLNRLTEEYYLNDTYDNEIVAYAAFFEMDNGFKKSLFARKEDIIKHGMKYSPSYTHKGSPWQNHFDSMAKKTVLKQILSVYAPKEVYHSLKHEGIYESDLKTVTKVHDIDEPTVLKTYRKVIAVCESTDELQRVWSSVDKKDYPILKDEFNKRKDELNTDNKELENG